MRKPFLGTCLGSGQSTEANAEKDLRDARVVDVCLDEHGGSVSGDLQPERALGGILPRVCWKLHRRYCTWRNDVACWRRPEALVRRPFRAERSWMLHMGLRASCDRCPCDWEPWLAWNSCLQNQLEAVPNAIATAEPLTRAWLHPCGPSARAPRVNLVAPQ